MKPHLSQGFFVVYVIHLSLICLKERSSHWSESLNSGMRGLKKRILGEFNGKDYCRGLLGKSK